MIVGFSKHGTGSGRGPTQYMTDELRAGRENAPPVVLRGNTEQTRKLIDSLDFKHKYTSGVLSFAPGEDITPEMEQIIMDRFESVAFAGLEPDQYNILWVRHTHAGHHELHFVTPRVELSTGKSLNIRPPGERTKEHFDDFRSEINASFGLADPTDPDRARNVSTPDHELKMASDALRSGQRPADDMRRLIDGVLSQRAVQGLIRSREDVLEHVNDLGFDVTRTGKDYITVSEPQSGQRWRLKGGLYAKDFEPSRTIEKSDAARQRDYSRPDTETAKHYAKRVERHIAARARYHQSRYSRTERNHRLEHVQEQVLVAGINRFEPLSGYLRRGLHSSELLLGSNSRNAGERTDTREKGRVNSVQQVRGSGDFVREDRHEQGEIRRKQQLDDTGGVLEHDRVRNPIIKRIEAFRTAIQRATERVRESAKRITDDVRAYFAGKQKTPSASQQIEQSSQQLERSTPTIRQAVQHEQALEQRQQQRSGLSL